jgi:hypothetical protein
MAQGPLVCHGKKDNAVVSISHACRLARWVTQGGPWGFQTGSLVPVLRNPARASFLLTNCSSRYRVTNKDILAGDEQERAVASHKRRLEFVSVPKFLSINLTRQARTQAITECVLT